ncbi:MAG: hypothetical protein ACRD3C_19545 [Vicinamibacterales bacterium]
MPTEYCFGRFCFVPLQTIAPSFFGLDEYLTGLALMVVAWTIADVRYRFRIATAAIPLTQISFAVVAAVGLLTLLTELWRAEQWLVLRGPGLTPAGWQAVLAGTFTATFLSWVWFAVIRPPVFSKHNAKRYARALYQTIVKGASSELSAIAGELTFSAQSLIHHAPRHYERVRANAAEASESTRLPSASGYANDILLLIADKRFCRAIVESSPVTAHAFFDAISKSGKYDVVIQTFGRNIVSEALANPNSFLYHEAEGYESGLLGYHKPLTQAMFGNYAMVEGIGGLLDPNYFERQKWTAQQWEAYCRVVLTVFRNYLETARHAQSNSLYQAKENIEQAASDLYKLDGSAAGAWESDTYQKLRTAVGFVKDVLELLNDRPIPDFVQRRPSDDGLGATWYDHVAEMIFELAGQASSVQAPRDLCWWIQHNTAWHEFFNFDKGKKPASKLVQYKVRRLIYKEIAEMTTFPNFKGAKTLGFCLNVMGLTVRKEEYYRDSRTLQRAVLSWTKRHFASLHAFNPRLAQACLVDGLTYEPEHRRLVRTDPIEGLRREPHHTYFEVDPPRDAANLFPME